MVFEELVEDFSDCSIVVVYTYFIWSSIVFYGDSSYLTTHSLVLSYEQEINVILYVISIRIYILGDDDNHRILYFDAGMFDYLKLNNIDLFMLGGPHT